MVYSKFRGLVFGSLPGFLRRLIDPSFSQSRPILGFLSLVIFNLEISIQINQTTRKVD